MKNIFALVLAVGVALGAVGCSSRQATTTTTSGTNSSTSTQTPATVPQSIYDFTLPNITGTETSLAQYRGKVVIFVNVASRCGYTGQYADLEAFYQQYKDRGVVILGFPANNFGGQEPGTNEEIATFCSTTYGVTFPMFAKISVKGDDMHPLYQFLTERRHNQSHDDFEINWNFNKVVLNREGRVVHHFKSGVKPGDSEFTEAIEALL